MKRPVLLFAVSAVLCSAGAMAAEPAPEPAADQAMVAGIDARTGKLRQLSDAEVAELSSKAQQQSSVQARSTTNAAWAAMPQTAAEAEKTLRVLPNGLSVATLPLSAMHSMTAQIGADGKVVISESSDDGHAHATQEVSE
ncbi:hypothetical protein ABB30_09180 [Stenotrophomonas ginsengisoli]|uniref:Secreted protein n=1 Tax=Stenotrophomonas ginsengisoli TaxID=336566 RepID=A0A0R0DFP2_9GAMM|nr:hypothetical protein [Stenotrophomonas ginsengisoli]KRG76862.1 hypothetical protein ABB30_09180 [Stenotrophomonas ginsengisoli]